MVVIVLPTTEPGKSTQLISGIQHDVCRHPAVDRNHLASGIAGLPRSQENDKISNVLWLTEVGAGSFRSRTRKLA
jgi:hypothetical protein